MLWMNANGNEGATVAASSQGQCQIPPRTCQCVKAVCRQLHEPSVSNRIGHNRRHIEFSVFDSLMLSPNGYFSGGSKPKHIASVNYPVYPTVHVHSVYFLVYISHRARACIELLNNQLIDRKKIKCQLC